MCLENISLPSVSAGDSGELLGSRWRTCEPQLTTVGGEVTSDPWWFQASLSPPQPFLRGRPCCDMAKRWMWSHRAWVSSNV